MNAAEERAQRMHSLATRLRKGGAIDAAAEARIRDAFPQPWRVNSISLQGVFFVLTAIGVGATYGMFNLLGIPYEGVVTGVIAIVMSESLLRGGWRRTGVEAALLIGGLIAIVSALPSSGEPESLLVIAAAFAIAAARLRHPLFALIATILVMVWTEVRFDLGLIVAIAVALLAAFALTRRIARPSTDATLMLLAVAMPIAGRFAADAQWRVMTIVLLAAYGVFALMLAIKRRDHALFLAAAVAFSIAAFDAAKFVRIAAEAKFATAGALLLVTAYAVHRVLRDRTRGFVLADPFAREHEPIEIAATLAMQPTADVPAASRESGGGFGGAGASGDY